LADAYLKLLETLDLEKVVVVGNSFGGWVAAEMALRNSSRIAGMALLNPVAIDTGSPDRKIVDPTQVPPADRPRLSFHNPALATPPGPDQLARMAANQEALRVYAGPGLHDPHLRLRLAGIRIPTVIVWGLSDRIVDEDYGRLWAASIPGARFEPLAEAGHFPQIEQTQRVATLVRELSPGGGPR
jgi:pimeloyl-ACP methyl ester carboxylesterase